LNEVCRAIFNNYFNVETINATINNFSHVKYYPIILKYPI